MPGNKRDLIGKTPFHQFADDDYSIKIAIIQRVDEINYVADLKILTGTAAERVEIPLTQAMAGPRSFLGGIPEKNSLVIVGYRRIQSKIREVCILGYLPTAVRSSLRFDPVAPDDPGNIDPADAADVERLFGRTLRFKRLNLRSGDLGGMSASGAELALTKDIHLANRAGDYFELRDSDRTLVTSSIHKVESEAGVRHISGPIRRGANFLPDDVFADGLALKDADSMPNPYYGQDELQAAGPGPTAGVEPRFATNAGTVLGLFNDETNFPPVTFSNGRKVHYPATIRGVSLDDIDSFSSAFVEDRLEMSHTTDLVQEVLEEIDGFSMDRRLPYIERVLGTVVGNSLNSTKDQRQYAQILKPKLFEDFASTRIGKFTLEAIDRNPTSPDTEVNTQAGAFLLRVRPPQGVGGAEGAAAFALSKQGKFFASLPGSSVEDYPSGSKNISAEISLAGALKMYLGAAAPSRISAHITCAGGIHLDVGRDAAGNAVTIHYHSGVKTIADGNPNEDDVAEDHEVRGVKRLRLTGKKEQLIEGSKVDTVSGLYVTKADRYNLNAFSGYSLNAGEWASTISGKTQAQYAQKVTEKIALGGKETTILAGGRTRTVLAGSVSTSVLAGNTSFTNTAGNFSVNVVTGSIGMSVATGSITLSTAAGAMSLSAATGALSLTGLSINLTATAAINAIAPQILWGGPAAVLGVVRGVPSMPPGSPTLDYITNLPLLGSATVRSL